MSDEAKVLSAEGEAKVRRLLDMALEGSFAAEEGRALLATLDAERAQHAEMQRIGQRALDAMQQAERKADEWKARAEKTEQERDDVCSVALVAIAARADAFKQRAERAEEGQNALAAEVRRMRERAEAAEAALAKVTAERDELTKRLAPVYCEHGTAYDGQCPECVLRQERDAALKACAETVAALKIAHAIINDPGAPTALIAKARRIGDAALTYSAPLLGRGYASPDEQRALAERVREACAASVDHFPTTNIQGRRAATVIRSLDLAALLGRDG